MEGGNQGARAMGLFYLSVCVDFVEADAEKSWWKWRGIETWFKKRGIELKLHIQFYTQVHYP